MPGEELKWIRVLTVCVISATCCGTMGHRVTWCCFPYSIPMELLPGPPDSLKTIREHPELFKVVCGIDVDCFEALLVDHPNLLFVVSVVHGLREGF